MKLLSRAPDGGKTSGVTAYFLVESKTIGSIVLLRFSEGSREAYHSHAFNALTIWLRGSVTEHHLNGTKRRWSAGQFKYTPRRVFHKIVADQVTWALSIRGPWHNRWLESRHGRLITLTHGRKEIASDDPPTP